jgi:hypothetical protein
LCSNSGQPAADRLPVWFQPLQQAGIAHACGTLVGCPVGFERDAVCLRCRSPPACAGDRLSSLAGAFAALAALAASWLRCRHPVGGRGHGPPNETVPGARIGTARFALLGVAFVTTGWRLAPADPEGRSVGADVQRVGLLPGLLLPSGEAHQCLALV